MHGSKQSVLALLVIAALPAAGCGDNTTPTDPTPPPTQITESFSGTLSINGSTTYPFNSTAAGTVTATLTALEPELDPPIQISIALGTWNGTTCTLIVANDAAMKNGLVSGTATGATGLCLRVADAKGTLTGPVKYTVDVTHF
jgi:hypothetical protein